MSLALYGASYSVYTRIARLVLIEKGVAFDLHEVDVFRPGGPPPEHLLRHPFGRIPVLDHDGFRLYETGAIGRYVDEAFAGPPLQPVNPKARARMNQVVSIMDAYAFRALVWDVFVERVSGPRQGRAPDEARIAAALPQCRRILQALDELHEANGPMTLADLWMAPMMALFRLAPEGADALGHFPRLAARFDAFQARPSAKATRSPVEG